MTEPRPAATPASVVSMDGSMDISMDTGEQPAEQSVIDDEPMTGPQRTYLHTLAREAGEEVPEPEPSKAAASVLIERLQRATGRIPADRDR